MIACAVLAMLAASVRSGSLERTATRQKVGFPAITEPERTGANTRPVSTSWGSLVRAQYRPSDTT